MRIQSSPHPHPWLRRAGSASSLLRGCGVLLLAVCATMAGTAQAHAADSTLPAQKTTNSTDAKQTPKRATARKHRHSSKKQAEPAPVVAPPPAPLAPKPPDWPVNDSPTKASVVWDSEGLLIDAKNSSLRQILDDVATATGARVNGLGTDERIFGVYGPGPAREVLSQLLQGSGYNVLMIGGRGTEPPQQIVLSVRPKGGVPSSPGSAQTASSGEEENYPQQEQEPPPPPAYVNPGFNTGNGPRTPQQIMQEMQVRQRILQMQQQQQQQQR